MKLFAAIAVALHALRLNALRSALTMLGIIIGVGSVITMTAVGAGAEATIADQIASLGSNLMIAVSGAITSGGVRLGFGTQMTLSEEDAAAIAREVPDVLVSVPGVRGTAQVIYGNVNWSTVIVRQPTRLHGGARLAGGAGPVVHPGGERCCGQGGGARPDVATTLFGNADPVGQTIRIKHVPFTVIGVLARKGQSMQGTDQDDVVILPLPTARNRVLGASQANRRAVVRHHDQDA